jgi:hypothetical protein
MNISRSLGLGIDAWTLVRNVLVTILPGSSGGSKMKDSRNSSNCKHTRSAPAPGEPAANRLRAFTGDSDLRVHFYLREDDHRARILCKAPHTTRPSEYFCMPLNLLEIVRVGSCLNLCRRRRGGYELVLWANLKFSTIERMSRCHPLPNAPLLMNNRDGPFLLHIPRLTLPRRRSTCGEHPRLRAR